MTDSNIHQGSCHCGAVAYEVKTDLSQVIDCNCSHCYRKGFWLTFVDPADFTLKQGEERLSEYLFNSHSIHHQFCSTCGVQPFGHGVSPDGKASVAINVRTLTDIEPFSVEPTYRFDGRAK